MPGLYPVVGPNALPATIYVEGINPTSRTITGNAIQAPVADNAITATYFFVNPAMPGGGIPVVPVATSQVSVGVAPVIQFFTINNVPVPPNPQVNPRSAGRVNFGNKRVAPPGTAPGDDIFKGYQTYGVNPGAANPNAPVLGRDAATFDAQVFNVNLPGTLHFVQNEWIINGGGGATNAWEVVRGRPEQENWVWLVNGNEIPANTPMLDMVAEQQPQPPYYQAKVVPALGNNSQITAGDSPTATGPLLVAKGLSGGAANFTVTNVAWTFKFRVYLVWSMPAGGGAAGDVIYPVALRSWSVVFRASPSVEDGWADTIAATSGVFTPGDFTTNPRRLNPVVTSPTANKAASIS